MPYTPTTWTNESPGASPVKYKITDDSLGIVAASAKIETVTTITPGTPVNAANLNKIEAGIQTAQAAAEAAQAAATAAVFPVAAVSLAQPSVTVGNLVVPWASKAVDNCNMVDLVAHSTRVTIPAGFAGWYQVEAFLICSGNIATQIEVYKNGATAGPGWMDAETGTISSTTLRVSRLIYLAAGDYIELKAYSSDTPRGLTAGLDMFLVYKV